MYDDNKEATTSKENLHLSKSGCVLGVMDNVMWIINIPLNEESRNALLYIAQFISSVKIPTETETKQNFENFEISYIALDHFTKNDRKES